MLSKKKVFIFFVLAPISIFQNSSAMESVGKHKTHELVFAADSLPDNPFDTYLLKLEITDPNGRIFTIDGFFDGDGNGGQEGKIWKARICPYETGMWSWRTIVGDKYDRNLAGLEGKFICESQDVGGIVADKHHFRFQDGGFTYLQGNFLDFSNGLRTTHTYMSETTTDAQRDNIMRRQRDFHKANKFNIYFANRGDYQGQSVTPWLGNALKNDKTKMDLSRWAKYDNYIHQFKANGMLAEIWFFADDSDFGKLTQKNKNRLFRYAMARTSAFSHTLYVIALEWAEGWSTNSVNSSGNYIQEHNPWNRLLSVHNIAGSAFKGVFLSQYRYWAFSKQNWATFIATQAGNSANSREVNQLAIKIRNDENIPHISEEFGVLKVNSNSRLRANMWANFCGGAAGGGTGSDLRAFMRFLEQSRAPFQRMHAVNKIVQGGGDTRFCLAEERRHYIVYSQSGAFTLNVKGDNLKGRWFNPRNPNASLGSAFSISQGKNLYTPPTNDSKAWVLWISDDSNLRSAVLHPTSASTLTQEIIKHIQR